MQVAIDSSFVGNPFRPGYPSRTSMWLASFTGLDLFGTANRGVRGTRQPTLMSTPRVLQDAEQLKGVH